MKSFCRAQMLLMAALLLLVGCKQEASNDRVVVCVPVYGQSLALGEEATLLTNFDSLVSQSDGRIVTQRLDHEFGYFDNSPVKEWVKRLVHYDKRTFELSVYSMAAVLAQRLGSDTLICVFPGGRGATAYHGICKGTKPYELLLDDIKEACDEAKSRGLEFIVPAVCWMHGESDMVDHTGIDYKEALRQFAEDINKDVSEMTKQSQPVRIVCYQTNQLTFVKDIDLTAFDCPEMRIPGAQMELIREDSLFWASTPVYPFTFAHEGIHLNAVGQQQVGSRAALSVLDIIRGNKHRQGLMPTSFEIEDQDVVVRFGQTQGTLLWDTISVSAVRCYGFSVVTPDGVDIAENATIEDQAVRIACKQSPTGCRVRYAVNGEPLKTGPQVGPRGNLRDTQGDQETVTIGRNTYRLDNWCYQFDVILE